MGSTDGGHCELWIRRSLFQLRRPIYILPGLGDLVGELLLKAEPKPLSCTIPGTTAATRVVRSTRGFEL